VIINLLLRRLGSERHPHTIVHLCFIAVLLFSTVLTWREALILKETYETDRQLTLSTAVANLERQFQYSLDSLLFYRNMLQYALANPLDSDNSRKAIHLFSQLRQRPVWSLNANTQRNMPLSGVSDAWVQSHALLDRSNGLRMQKEIGAALEFSFILQFNEQEKDFEQRLWYISRAGFFVSSLPPANEQQTLDSYRTLLQRGYFTHMAPAANPQRRLRWTATYNGILNEGPMVTVSVPVDSEGYWYGVLAMDFTSDRIHAHLQQAMQHEDSIMLLDHAMNTLAVSAKPSRQAYSSLSAEETGQLKTLIKKKPVGQLRVGSRFISWTRMNDFDGVMLSIQTLKEGIRGETGRVAIILLLTWLVFTLLLLFAWLTIYRLIDRLLTLQRSLYQRANYDPLTQLLNRGAFFERARSVIERCQRYQHPVALIQLDIDYFKGVNDSWGHHAGDLALAHVAGILKCGLRASDLCGRIGGEEFCLLLPETRLKEAVKVAERIRSRLAAQRVVISPEQQIQISASLGVASSEEQGCYQIEHLQSIADRRLYLAKENGRNRVYWQD
jgi:diguanylate cyclase (GGDEF)-like protein